MSRDPLLLELFVNLNSNALQRFSQNHNSVISIVTAGPCKLILAHANLVMSRTALMYFQPHKVHIPSLDRQASLGEGESSLD